MSLSTRIPIATDIIERTVATYVVTVLGLATSDGVGVQDVLSLGTWKLWAAAGLVSAFTLLKSLIAVRIGGKSASLAPSVELKPEPVTDH